MKIQEIIKSAKIIKNCVFKEEALTEEGLQKFETAYSMTGVFKFDMSEINKVVDMLRNGITENGMIINAKGGVYGPECEFFGMIVVLILKSEKKPEPVTAPVSEEKRDYVNIIDSFFFYMWNAWGKDECDKVFGGMSDHFWSKWDKYATQNVWGAAEKFYADLDNDYKRKLVERACEMYNGNNRAKK